jgi:hypothetical protein
MWNQAFFRKVLVRDGRVGDHEYEEPFASLLGSHKAQIVELMGVEPMTSCLPTIPGLNAMRFTCPHRFRPGQTWSLTG